MTPKSASNVLLEMNKTNPEKVLAIFSGMDNASRSKVMSAFQMPIKKLQHQLQLNLFSNVIDYHEGR